MLGRMKDAVADAAETLRRAFAGLKVFEAAPEGFQPQGLGWQALECAGSQGLEALVLDTQALLLLNEAVQGRKLEPFQAKVVAEAGWAAWGAEAEVVQMAPLEAGRAARMVVPPLPRAAVPAGKVEGFQRPGTRRYWDPVQAPGRRLLEVGLGRCNARAGLPTILGLPVPILGESPQRLPKGLWMRYSLELVRRTGENVRNLEVVGLYRIPRKGVRDLRHDPKSSRIMLHLDESALNAPREAFILAKRKDDGTLVSCFVEGS
jgi:hypothetical protein